jgi:hypothetical protein
MHEEDAAQFLATNSLFCSQKVGGSLGWGAEYILTDGCFLILDYTARNIRTNGFWGGNGRLEKAYIQSNGVDIISIPLTNAP